MTELPSIQGGGRSEFIDGLDDDFTDYSHHRKYDAVIRGYLTQDDRYKRLRHPKTRDDYKELVVLVVSEYPPLRNRNLLEYYSDLIEREYTGAEVNDFLWGEIKRMMDICLEYGRFRNVRGLGELEDSCYSWFRAEESNR